MAMPCRQLQVGGTIGSFLREGADANAQGGVYGNALQAASNGGHDDLVQQLKELTILELEK